MIASRSHTVREAHAAGNFYPRDPLILSTTLERLFRTVRPLPDIRPKALVVPHAGYRLSGRTAAQAYASLASMKQDIRRVVLVGPAHFSSIAGIAIPAADGFSTPLGEVPIDDELREIAVRCESVLVDDLPHAEEHSLEVQIPFLQRALRDITILPVAVARVPGWVVASFLEATWGDDSTLLVISTDLSHYLGYEEARDRDRATAEAIVELDAARLGPDDACGYYPLLGFLHAGARHGLRGRILDLRNSADVTGERRDIVGYGAFAFEEMR